MDKTVKHYCGQGSTICLGQRGDLQCKSSVWGSALRCGWSFLACLGCRRDPQHESWAGDQWVCIHLGSFEDNLCQTVLTNKGSSKSKEEDTTFPLVVSVGEYTVIAWPTGGQRYGFVNKCVCSWGCVWVFLSIGCVGWSFGEWGRIHPHCSARHTSQLLLLDPSLSVCLFLPSLFPFSLSLSLFLSLPSFSLFLLFIFFFLCHLAPYLENPPTYMPTHL